MGMPAPSKRVCAGRAGSEVIDVRPGVARHVDAPQVELGLPLVPVAGRVVIEKHGGTGRREKARKRRHAILDREAQVDEHPSRKLVEREDVLDAQRQTGELA